MSLDPDFSKLAKSISEAATSNKYFNSELNVSDKKTRLNKIFKSVMKKIEDANIVQNCPKLEKINIKGCPHITKDGIERCLKEIPATRGRFKGLRIIQ